MNMEVYHNSQDSFYRSPFGAVQIGTIITIRVKVIDTMAALRCTLALWHNSEKMTLIPMNKISNDVYEAHIKTDKKPCLLWYHFIFENYDERFYYGNNDLQLGGVGRVYESNPKSYQITVYEKDKVPSWYKEGILYQIFPDRFNRGSDYQINVERTKKRDEKTDRKIVFEDDWNKMPVYDKDETGSISSWNFYGGSLRGIIEKLDYLKDLNVSIIYLNPIQEARSNHRYDTGDYKNVDSLLGTVDDLKELLDEAHKRDMHIILDGVYSHTGADSIYFNKYNNYDVIGAYQGEESEYYKWYNFKENNKEEYDCWWGVKDLPNVNELEESFIDFICRGKDSVINYYLKLGIDGIRLDVADELPDEFIKEVRKALHKKKETILLGEVWEDASNKISYGKLREYFQGKELQSTMNYDMLKSLVGFMKGYITNDDLVKTIMRQMENYPTEYFYSNFNLISSHDRTRILTLLGDARNSDEMSDQEKIYYKLDKDKYDLAKSRLKALTTFQFALPGVPCIYYGDEAGIEGHKDPYNRRTYPWGYEDCEILEHYKKITNIRKECLALKRGDFNIFKIGEHGIGIKRNYKNEELIILISRGIFYNEITNIDIEVSCKEYEDLFNGDIYEVKDGRLKFELLPLGYKILRRI